MFFKRPRLKNPKAEGLGAFAVGLFFLAIFIVPIIEKSAKFQKATYYYLFMVLICMFLITYGLYKYFSSKEDWQYDADRKKALLFSAICFSILTIIQISLPVYSTIMRIAALIIMYFVIYKISRKD